MAITATITITDDGGQRIDIEEVRTRTLTDDATGEKIQQSYGHRSSMALGDYGGDIDKFSADAAARVQSFVGKDLAPFVAAAALETAKAVQAKADADAYVATAIANAQAQVAAILQAAVGPSPVDITPLQEPPTAAAVAP